MTSIDLTDVRIITVFLSRNNVVISVYYNPTKGNDTTIVQLMSARNKFINQYSIHWYNKKFTEKEIKDLLIMLNFKCVPSTKLNRHKTKEIYKVTDKTRVVSTLLLTKVDLPNTKKDIA